jgi:beta-galactosidase
MVVHATYHRPDMTEQTITGKHTIFITRQGDIEVSYDYAPKNAKGTLLEVGMSFLAPNANTEFRWIGQGPYAGYPGKDRLNEFGIYHLTHDDIRFQGNRRQVELGLLTDSSGEGLAIVGDKMDVALESTGDGIVLSHNAAVSGRGNKGMVPEEPIVAETLQTISGSFKLIPITQAWPASLNQWFGRPGEKAELQQPYYYSYDQ